jgi:LysM repeat protein
LHFRLPLFVLLLSGLPAHAGNPSDDPSVSLRIDPRPAHGDTMSVPPMRPSLFDELLGEARGPVLLSYTSLPGDPRGMRRQLQPGSSAGYPSGGQYVVQRGDTLSAIAQRFYGSYHLWPLIFQANRHLIADPDLIHPGQVLTLPGLVAGAAQRYIPPVVVPPQSRGFDPQLAAVARAGGVTTRSPAFDSWFREASYVARSSWRFPVLANRYGRAVTQEDFLRAILYIESRGVHQANGRVTTSSAGALGFMQLMPGTARGLGVNAADPRQNLLGGAKYLAECLASRTAQVPGDSDVDRLVKAAASYNKGPYDRTLAAVTWDQYVNIGVPETVRYGILTKMALGFPLTARETSWMARDRGIAPASVASLADGTFQKSRALV